MPAANPFSSNQTTLVVRGLSSATENFKPREIFVPSRICSFSDLRQMQQAGCHSSDLGFYVLVARGQVRIELSPGPPHSGLDLTKQRSEISTRRARARCSKAHFREQRVHRFNVCYAESNRIAQLARQNVEIGNKLRKRLRIAVLRVEPCNIVVACGSGIFRQHTTCSNVQELNTKTNVRYASNSLCVLPACEKGRKAKSDSSQCRADRTDRRPSIPPHNATALTWRPAGIEGIPPAHSLIPVWTRRHSGMARAPEVCRA